MRREVLWVLIGGLLMSVGTLGYTVGYARGAYWATDYVLTSQQRSQSSLMEPDRQMRQFIDAYMEIDKLTAANLMAVYGARIMGDQERLGAVLAHYSRLVLDEIETMKPTH